LKLIGKYLLLYNKYKYCITSFVGIFACINPDCWQHNPFKLLNTNIGEYYPSQYIILHSQACAIWYTAWDNIHQYSCNNPIVWNNQRSSEANYYTILMCIYHVISSK
jgi:hypothetical protein